jgi:GMP synthase (glutamine-hydrolysing)
MKPDAILVLDFGGQYCHLLVRRVREQEVYSDLVPHDISPDEIDALRENSRIKGLIFSGGPASVYDENAPRFNPKILSVDLPVLGLCYGHQLIAYISGGNVKTAERKEYGITYATIDKPIGVLKNLRKREKVWMSHGDTVYSLPDTFEVLAHTDNSPVAAFKHRQRSIYGLQWHPEVIHTENGMQMLKNFIFEVCRCAANWNIEDFVEKAVAEVERKVKHRKAIVALSGGIDSATVTALTAKAIGRNLTAVFVDHGFMRAGEPKSVAETFGRIDIDLVSVDARRRFQERLKGIVDPEQKRKLIGEEFIRVFETVAKDIGADYLIQGTIYPDRIESGFRKFSDKIKTHHNVAGLPLDMEFTEVIEPLRDLYKDEVRQVAKKLGLPREIVHRQPFPGPGLAVRIIGEVTPQKLEIVRQADRIVTEEIEKKGLHDGLWQYFAILMDTKSTGVKGDAGAYGYTVAVRCVESKEAMTASFTRIPYETLETISTRITNEIPQVTRVVYDVTHKPPATIEWE